VRDRDEVQALLERVLAQVSADEASVSYSDGGGHATRFGENAITQNMGGESERLSLTAAFGTRHGSASTTRVDAESLAALVSRAEANARVSPEDPEFVPYPGSQTYPATAPRFFAEVARLTPLDLAGDVARVIEIVKAGGYRTGGLFSYNYGGYALANSHGLLACDRPTNLGYSLTVHGPRGSGACARNAERPAGIDAAALARTALETARQAQDPQDIEPGDYTVIFEPQAVADLLGPMAWCLRARDTEEGSTAFTGKLGTRIAAPGVTLATVIDSPLLPAGPFGDAGLAARPMTWIRAGVLERLMHDRYWARQKGETPDPSLMPLFLAGEERSLDELVAGCADGLLVKRLWYIRFVDEKQLLLTGMTRDGFFRIHDGKVVHPVKNLRFNESPLTFLQNAVAMSRAERVGNGWVVPAVMSEGFTFSSKTESV